MHACGDRVLVGRTAFLVPRRNVLDVRRPGRASLLHVRRFGADILDTVVTG